MDLLATISQALLIVVFGTLAAASLRQWRRQGGAVSGWVFAGFALLALVTLLGAAVPDEPDSEPLRWLNKLVVVALPLFPYCLFRFTTAMKPVSRRAGWTALGLTIAVAALALSLPLEGAIDDDPDALFAAFVLVLLLQWTGLSLAVALLLWKAGDGQPTVARRRMRTLAVASITLAVALVVAGASSGDERLSLVVEAIAIVSGGLFFVAFLPPPVVRVIWRRPEQERLRVATSELAAAGSRDEVIERLLPEVSALVGARGAALVDSSGETIAEHGVLGEGEHVELDLSDHRLVLALGPYTPFFGTEELGLLRSVGALAELAIERLDLFESERDARGLLERQTRFSQLLVESSADGILAFDRELRYTVWNPGMERLSGIASADVLDRKAFEVFPFLQDIGEDRYFRDALAGRTVASSERPYIVPETGQEGFFEALYSPIHGEGGEVIGGLGIVREVTERKRALEERERLLREQAARAEAEATAEMVQHLQVITDTALAHLTLDDLVDELLDRVREILAVDTATLLLLDEDGETLVPHVGRGLAEDGTGHVTVRIGEGFAGRVAAKREVLMLDEVNPDTVVSPMLVERGIQKLLGAPMITAGRLTGVIHVGRIEARPFSEEDAGLLRLVADRAALAVEHGRVYRQEHRIAETLQRSLLPEQLPEVPGVEVAARYLPGGAGAVGGDWYDMIPLAGGRVGLAMGDVVGHGVGAASLMGQLRSGLRAYALDGDSPAGVLARLDRLLQALEGEGMATLLYLVYDPYEGDVSFASAGHPPPLLLEPGREPRFVEGGASMPLGVARAPTFGERTLGLERGSTLVMYTDGVVERRGVSLDDGLARLARAAADAPQGVDALCDHVLGTLLPDGPANDDAALLVLRVDPVSTRDLALRLAAEPEALSLVRTALRGWLADARVPVQLLHDLLVASGEACANVVEHAYGPAGAEFEVGASFDDGVLELRVVDAGRWRPARGTHRGRGLALMRALMDDVEVVQREEGTTVVLRRRIDGEAAA